MSQVFLYDTTLRDGTQREDISLSVDDKLAIAKRLADFGFHYIEGGWREHQHHRCQLARVVR